MSFYRQMGKILKRDTQCFEKKMAALYREQVMGTKGFSGIQSILYHHNAPTEFYKSELIGECGLEYEEQGALRPRHFYTDNVNKEPSDAVMGREYVLGNEDLLIGVVNPTEKMDYFYRNSDGDELLFVHYGTGKIETTFGTLSV